MKNTSRLSRSKKKPTLADVAKLAGVSLGSASRALSVPEQVKPKTLERVSHAVSQLGYIRNGAASALASRRTKTIAALYPTLNNPIFAHSTHSMQQTLWEKGYQLLIASHEYHIEDEIPIIRTLLERGIDGLIMVGTKHDQAIFDLLSARSLPYVLTWSVDDSAYPHCVGISNYDAAFALAQHVIAKGHTRIGICGGSPLINERAHGRRQGIIDAAQHAGISIPKKWMTEQAFSYQGGRQGFQYFWGLDDKPSVIFFGTDLQAIGALNQCHKMHIQVPDEISIVGFDGIEEGEMMHPALTTTRIPADEIGTKAARLMLELLKGDNPAAQTAFTAEIITGGSLKRL